MFLHIKQTILVCSSYTTEASSKMITSDDRGRIHKGTVVPCFIDGERPQCHLLTKKYKNITLRSAKCEYGTKYKYKSHQ